MRREEARGNAIYTNYEMRFQGPPTSYHSGQESSLSTYGQKPEVGYANYPTNDAAPSYYYDRKQVTYESPQWHDSQPAAVRQQQPWQPPVETRPIYQQTPRPMQRGNWEQEGGGDAAYAAHQAEIERLRKLQEERMRRYEEEKARYYGEHAN